MTRKETVLQAILVFTLTLLTSLYNANFHSFGFADAGEFALVTSYGGIAHAPGFPAYVFLAWWWSSITQLFGLTHITSLVLFSSLCIAFAAVLLSFISRMLTGKLFPELNKSTQTNIAIITGLSPIVGTTIWHWSHSIEVYGFQVLTIAILLFGFVLYETSGKKIGMYIGAIGMALGLANHHLTMLLFAPFLLLLLTPGWLEIKQESKKKKNFAPIKRTPFYKEKLFYHFTGLTIGITLFFYGWMYIRSGTLHYFDFGSPDSFGRLLYHLTGGAWIKNTQEEVRGIVALRFPYFMRITFEQIFLFIPFLILGITGLFARKLYRLPLTIIGYYLVVLIYQLRIDQTADTDAYMVMPFFLVSALLPVGMAKAAQWDNRITYLFPLFLLIGAVLNAPKTDLRNYNVSDSLMHELDESAPQGSIVLFADWTSVITYNYYRKELNFRPDLIVLNYDLKFTNFKLLPANYPLLYQNIKKEYDQFILLLEASHPQEIYNTGCTLDNPELLDAYLASIKAIQNYCTLKNIAFMADPKAYILLSQNKVFPTTIVSGVLVSTIATHKGKEFPALKLNWLDSPRLMMEPAAADKLVDLEAALDFNRTYYNQIGKLDLANKSEASFQRIKKIQRRMKKRMEFLFRPS